MKNVLNLLLIAGTGRNTGKTTLACSIIEKYSNEYQIIGLKISPHFHGGTDSLKLLSGNKFFNIYEETSASSRKDSSKMLKAGAYRVFYIETNDEHLPEAFMKFQDLIPTGNPIVCESPALRNYINPDIFIIVDSEANRNKKESILAWKSVADKYLETDKDNIEKFIDGVCITDNRWRYLH